MSEKEQLEASIEALEAQRGILGDAVVDTMIAAAHDKLATLTPVPPVDQQRKQVTILFADIVGSTMMSEKFDPEDVMNIMDGGLRRFGEAVQRHGGRVGRFMGDGMLAFFGVPIAREDDPEQAIRAGLDMLKTARAYSRQVAREWGIDNFAVRIGINTGLVVMGEMGSGGTVDYTAMGDAVNLASRLESAAPIGTLLIGHDTYQHVHGLFDVRALAPIVVKGKVEPVRVYIVERARPRAFRLGRRGVAGIETAMVGRDRELHSLQDLYSAAMENDQRQLITIVGEAGLGKSRLLYEFDRWLDEYPEPVQRFKGRAWQETQNVPYVLFRDLIATCFQIQEGNSVEGVRTKIEQGIGEVVENGSSGESKSGQMQAHFIGQLLGFDFNDSPYLSEVARDAKQLHDRALIYLGNYFKRLTTSYPVVVLLEDIHWADNSSLNLIGQLALMMTGQRLLIVSATRPDLYERRPSWGQDHSLHRRLNLKPLSERDCGHLVEEILRKVTELPENLRELVVSGAEGNPFYAEELIKMLIEDCVIVKGETQWQVESSRLANVRVPATLVGVLQASLDSLSSEEHMILQQASVVGRTFWDDAIIHLSRSMTRDTDEDQLPDLLSNLQVKELIFHHDRSAISGVQEHSFKHAILHEVTYESVLKRIRHGYHALVAEWLIEQDGNWANENSGLIADHLAQAGDSDRAAAYYTEAGKRAITRFANSEAVIYLCQALDLIPSIDYSRRYDLLLLREGLYDLQGDREAQAQDLVDLEALADELADYQRQVQVALRKAIYSESISDFPSAAAAAQRSIALAHTFAGSEQWRISNTADGHRRWGVALYRMGEYENARTQFEEARHLSREAKSHRIEADCLRNLGMLSRNQGDHRKAEHHCKNALQIYREIGNSRGESRTLNSLGAIHHDQGNYVEAGKYYEQSLQLKREIGDRSGESGILSNLGMASQYQGDYAGARAYYERALPLKREMGDRRGESLVLCNMSLLYHQLRDDKRARNAGQQALEITRMLGDRLNEGYALTYLGHALARLDFLAEAKDAYQQALAIRRELNQSSLMMECLAGMARVSLTEGDLATANTYVDEILDFLKGDNLDGAEEPFRVYLTCYRILRASKDGRASEILTTTYWLLQDRVASIEDDSAKLSFLQNVSTHKEIVTAFEAGLDETIDIEAIKR